MRPIPLGRYRHYKGKEYEVVGFAKHSETLEDMVIYKALYGDRGIWVRPLSMWENLIETGGKTVKRFEFAGDSTLSDRPDELLAHKSELRITPMGVGRVKKNLSLEIPDVVAWCQEKITVAGGIVRKGKNWYVRTEDAVITINAQSYTVITAHKPKISVREATAADGTMLEDFLYHAIFVPPGEAPPPREILHEPDVFLYIDKFGEKRGDCGVIAEYDGKIAGAAWTRRIPAYGYVDDDTPELAISILPGFRGCSVGTKLMTRLFDLLRSRGFARTSLAVQKKNAAVRFYERLGYETVGERGEEYIMLKNLEKERSYP